MGKQGNLRPVLAQNSQRIGPVTQRGDDDVRRVDKPDRIGVLRLELMQLHAGLRRTSTDTAKLHQQLTGVEPETGQAEDPVRRPGRGHSGPNSV